MAERDAVAWPVPGEAEVYWQARPFGQKLDDLQVDLHRRAPFATSHVLGTCLGVRGNPVSETETWAWTVNRRLQGLLAVTQATRGDGWTLSARCRAEDCAELMDIPLQLSAFARGEDPLRTHVRTTDVAGIEVRIPTGEDQRAWIEAAIEPERMVQRLLPGAVNAALPAAVYDAVDASLAEADPLTALELETSCPQCGVSNWIPLDLETECLRMLAAEQPRLLDDIHQLALAYHWSEEQILAIPAPRRRQYLARIEHAWQ